MQQSARDVLRDMFKWRQRKHFFGMCGQALRQIRNLVSTKMALDVVNDQKSLVCKDIDAKPAAEGAAFTARHSNAFFLNGLDIQHIEFVDGRLCSAIELFGQG